MARLTNCPNCEEEVFYLYRLEEFLKGKIIWKLEGVWSSKIQAELLIENFGFTKDSLFCENCFWK